MNRFVFALSLLVISCQQNPDTRQADKPEATLDTVLTAELATMVEVDQIAAQPPQGKYKEFNDEEWQRFKDSVFTTHQKRLAEIFNQQGFPGYDVVGEEGARNFWLMVQHADFNPAFQDSVLTAMKAEVDRANADPRNYALLVDRVNVNTGKPQVYGTQVTYNTSICQAMPKSPLLDSVLVNQRRAEVGLEPLETYLNMMSQLHFEMNKESYEKQGITQPALYPEE